MQRMFGITGSISVGKSTVSKFFRELGVKIIDADIISREVVEIPRPGWCAISNTFGEDYLNDDRTVNRTKLGQLVFGDPEALKKLNGIMKPLIQAEAYKQITRAFVDGEQIVAYDAALLIEGGAVDMFRPLVVVTCPYEIQLTRLMARNKLSEEDARKRISMQLSSEEKVKHANYVINSSGTLEETKQQVLEIFNKIKLGTEK